MQFEDCKRAGHPNDFSACQHRRDSVPLLIRGGVGLTALFSLPGLIIHLDS